MNWHTKSIPDILKELGSTEYGLNDTLAKKLLVKYGPNSLPEEKTDSYFVIFLKQFQSPLIYILLGASAIVFALGHTSDSIIIMIVLIFNAIVGAWQEGKAGKTLNALKKLSGYSATVLRNHKETLTSESEIVPGDILILREGDKIPADARIFETENLEVDESALTGESNPVYKNEIVIHKENLQVSDQKNMLFKSTFIIGGKGKAVVTSTGTKTIIGNIALSIEKIDTEMPLKKSIRTLSRTVIFAVFGISVVLFFIGILYGNNAKDMIATVVAIAISAIPEGLPVVVTLILATGVWRMSKQNALIKRLQAVEALGQADVLAVDKTGTITKNQMMASILYTNSKMFSITGTGYDPKGKLMLNKKIIEPQTHEEVLLLGKIACFVSSATVEYNKKSSDWERIAGDPTEAAMLIFSQKIGFDKNDLEHEYTKLLSIPFDSKIRYTASLNIINNKPFLSVMGATETILEHTKKIWINGGSHQITDEYKKEIHIVMKDLSSRGLRVIAMGTNFNSPKNITSDKLPELCFVGLIGISDSIRPEAKNAIMQAKNTGIRIVMITGDHKYTAEAIAREAGIFQDGDEVLTGEELDQMTAKELSSKLQKVTVFARVSPEHKMKIIDAYRHRGQVIAMTGDGVNDALSLASADLGVAMGKSGTEVAKESADIVLMDDNLGSIVSAIEEGRNIYKSIKKVVSYLFSTAIGEILVVTSAIFLVLPLPFTASQIIWLNMVTDGFLVIALALEPKEKNVLLKKTKQNKTIIDKDMFWRMVLFAISMTVGTIFLFILYLPEGLVKASTMSVTSAAIFQWMNAWNNRSDISSIFSKDWASNKYLIGATFLVIILQIFAVYNPFMQKILRTSQLSAMEWSLIIAVSFSAIIIDEIRKSTVRTHKKRHFVV